MLKQSTNPWWLNAIIYELYVDKFSGDFKGLTDKLDYIKYLGVNTLWLLPFYPSPMVDDGYDVADYTLIREDLGTIKDFHDFVRQAHHKGLKVIIDFVLNHTSDKHPWFIESRSSKNNSKRDWYIWSSDDKKYSQAYVHFGNIKENNWIKDEKTGEYYYATFYPQQPDLNWDNPKVYQTMLDIADFWLSKGVDGFRLDAVSRLVKRDGTNCFSLPETHSILKKFRSDMESSYPQAVLLAESGGWPDEAKTFFGDGDECQLVLNFPLATNLLYATQDYDLTDVERVWKESQGICNDCRWAAFLTSHDSVDLFFLDNEEKKRKLTRGGILLERFGQEGSSSFAARLFEVCQGDKEKILWVHRQLLNLPAVPVLYYGNEIGMENKKLSEKPSDFREYVRGDFDWGKVNAQMKDSDSILNRVREMIRDKR
jgi:maltose alpha-D-glucosyltransferase/alpha-amylase